MGTKHVYTFGAGKAEGNTKMKDLLGGKGANLAEMSGLGMPVPAGFTITTEVCAHYYANEHEYPKELEDQVEKGLHFIEKTMNAKFGDAKNPLLLSVRSGARASMPGMMNTVLNLGLTSKTLAGLIEKTQNERFVYDSYRRLIQMYSEVVMGVESEHFERMIDEVKKTRNVKLDTELTVNDLKDLCERFKAVVRKDLGRDFPDNEKEQLWGGIGAVFGSWNTKRAIEYRRLHGIPEHWGTAVSLQAMVFGNMGEDCATGVAFTRDPATGEHKFFGEYLINAQGEDVVSGVRTPQPISVAGKKSAGELSLEEAMPGLYGELESIYKKLEKHYRDMQDIEFTIQKGKLWMLQTRNGKRTANSAVKIAVDMVGEGLIDKKEAIKRVEPEQLDQLLHPTIDPKAPREVVARGLPASPGAAVGRAVFNADDAAEWAARGEKVILVRLETSPDDIKGMAVAEGILTARGGMTCVAGDAQVLTDRGLISAERAFSSIEDGVALRILSFDTRSMRPVWRNVIAAGRRQANAVSVAISQTGHAEDNELRLTPDHKVFVLNNRRLMKTPLEKVLQSEGFLTVVDRIPALGETVTSPELAYVVGAILSDGYIKLGPTKGYVTFVQKPTPEKADFIAAVERRFLQAFGVPFSYIRERESEGVLRGRPIKGSVEDRICFRREPAARLTEIREALIPWILTLDDTALLHFLAGFVDGDGTYSEGSSNIRLQVSVGASKRNLLEGLAISCLRLGIVPQITGNRDDYNLQIAERVEDILAYTERVRAEIPARTYESRCLSVRGLFDDIVDHVNFMGRVREGLKRNIMFGSEKIRRDILPLCPGDSYRELKTLLDAPIRSYRVREKGGVESVLVYNFEVDAGDDLDKNFIVFTSRLTPILVSNSHAAVVARGMGTCCVAGCNTLTVDADRKVAHIGTITIKEGDPLTLDGSRGEVMLGRLPTTRPELTGEFGEFMKWVDEFRTLKVRANADTPHDSEVARKFGAEGIGLCRTEHMFFDGNRIDAMREMILAEDLEGRKKALMKILPMQKGDFKGIFRVMSGFPVTIRLLDPPLHEFLPHTDEEVADLSKKMGVPPEKLRAKALELHEFNPMLGHRGCRLGVTFPEIYAMQAQAIMEAACELVRDEKIVVIPEIEIPLVGHFHELELMRSVCDKVCKEVIAKTGQKVEYTIGTMIELPRAAITADEIAKHADFFSFGTNDLTQTTFGFSRDDAGRFLREYVEKKILPADPFVAIDRGGVGKLMKIAIELGRKTNPKLEIGICGEHGGEASSVAFCYEIGLNYVSCSPYRVPIARLAAAKAALGMIEGVGTTA